VGDYIAINLRGYGLVSTVSVEGLLTTSCGHNYEACVSVKGGEFLTGSVINQFLKNDCVPCCKLVSYLDMYNRLTLHIMSFLM
jgi:hypothetical protein